MHPHHASRKRNGHHQYNAMLRKDALHIRGPHRRAAMTVLALVGLTHATVSACLRGDFQLPPEQHPEHHCLIVHGDRRRRQFHLQYSTLQIAFNDLRHRSSIDALLPIRVLEVQAEVVGRHRILGCRVSIACVTTSSISTSYDQATMLSAEK